MEGKDELDRVIDGALAGYSGAEPLAGIEERVLNRVRVVEAGRRRFGWVAVLAVVAAVVAAVIVVRAPHHTNPKTYRVGVPAVERPAPPVERPVAAAHKVKARAVRPRALPKQEQFPARTPMTNEERALVAFVRQHPAEARQVFAELRKRGDEPIEIPAIQIPPLQSDGAE